MKRKINVVGAAIIDCGRVLAARRPESPMPYKSLKWEFPGGKIEPGETPRQAIAREIEEELGCRVTVDALLPELEHEYPDFTLKLTICLCRLLPGETPRRLEHAALRWLSADALPTLDWAEADARCLSAVAAAVREATDHR